MDPLENTKDPSEPANALQVIPRNPAALPSAVSPLPENSGYPGYGPANRMDKGVRLRDVWIAISKRRWLIVFITLLITATTAVMLARKPDIYLAETRSTG